MSLKERMLERYPTEKTETVSPTNVFISFSNNIFMKSLMITLMYIILSNHSIHEFILSNYKDKFNLYYIGSSVLFLLLSYIIINN